MPIPKELRPMLACNERSVTRADVPGLLRKHKILWGTEKIDGVRCTVRNTNFEDAEILQGFSRKNILIPNNIIQCWIEDCQWMAPGVDGELVVEGGTFHQTQSKVMTRITAPFKWKYYIFDYAAREVEHRGYLQRLQKLKQFFKWNAQSVLLEPQPLATTAEVMRFYQQKIDKGSEGVILRTGNSPYKHGRATWDEGYMFKMKEWQDSEAVITGFREKQHNTNEQTQDEQGYAKRSKKQAGMYGAKTLGTIEARDIFTGVEFDIGSGWDDDFALEVWNNREDFRGEIFSYKFTPHGVKEKPRQPVFKGMRDD